MVSRFEPSNETPQQSGRWKTVCTSAVLRELGVDVMSYHYCSCVEDMSRILRRNGYHVRSRKSTLGKGGRVCDLRKRITKRGEGGRYIVRVRGHVLLLDEEGRTICDTDPRKRDRREVLGVYLVKKTEQRERIDEAHIQHLRERGIIPPWMTGSEKLCDLSHAEIMKVRAWQIAHQG